VAGLDATGFTPKALDDINSEMSGDIKAAISPTLDTSSTALLGQLLGSVSSQLRQLWELGQAIWASQDPDQANGASLTAAGGLTGTIREAPSYSTDLLNLDLDAGSYAPGTLVVSVVTDPTLRFANKLTVTSPGGVVAGVLMQAEQTGPVRANAGTLTTIASPVVGFNSVSSDPSDAVLGSNTETDTALRLRREQELTRRGSSTVDAMRTDILQVDGVTFCAVYENATDTTDGAGRPPHSVEAVVLGGVDADVATGIWDTKPSGIQAYGLTSAVHADSQGVSHTIGFSRPATINIYVSVAVNVIAGKYAGDTVLKQALVDYGDQNQSVGYDVIHAQLIKVVMNLPGVIDTVISIDSSPAPVPQTNYVIGVREIADLDTSRIAVFASYVTGPA
jgi:uncharacterized phage protein gp47/JayE